MTDARDINRSGPDYPLPPAAGSNAIGVAQIGASPVGDISAFDFWSTVMSQFSNAPRMMGLLQRFLAAADPTKLFETWFDDIWNIETAKSYGLDIWGRIVGINRVIEVPFTEWFGFAESEPGTLSWNSNVAATPSPVLGFAEGAPSYQPFGLGAFGPIQYVWSETDQNQGGGAYWSGESLTSNFRLSDESYRFLIMTKAAQNISDSSIPGINQILLALFPNRGNAYVTDGYQGISYFGFNESQNALTFGQGVFYNGETVPTMVMTYNFNFTLSAVEKAIVLNSGVLPKPTGVSASVVIQPAPVAPPPALPVETAAYGVTPFALARFTAAQTRQSGLGIALIEANPEEFAALVHPGVPSQLQILLGDA
jgi:hypothetical protein